MDLGALRRCFEGELYHLMSWSFLPPHHIDFLFHALVSAAGVSDELLYIAHACEGRFFPEISQSPF
jgi:hypothetical protein